MDDDRQRHLCMLGAAEFRALRPIDTGAIGVQKERRGVSRNQVPFPDDVRDPEAVNDVARHELDLYRLPGRDVQLVGIDEKLARVGIDVVNLPPPLVACYLNSQSAARMLGEGASNGEVEGEEEQEQEGRRADQAGEHARVAAVIIVRHADDRLEILARRPPSSERRPERGDHDARPHERGHDQHRPKEPARRAVWRSNGIEDILRAVTGRREREERAPRERATSTSDADGHYNSSSGGALLTFGLTGGVDASGGLRIMWSSRPPRAPFGINPLNERT